MPKYVAFLRAINVGGHTVKMDYLRSLFEAIGFAKVETFIASGNVIFDSKSRTTQALDGKIENHLRETLGYEVKTFVRSTSELVEIANYKPFAEAELNAAGNTLYVGFVAEKPSNAAIQKLLSFSNKINDFHVRGREVYWLSRTKLGESDFSGALLEKTLGMRVTLRNRNTVTRMAAKYG